MIASNPDHSYFVQARKQPLLPFARFDLSPMAEDLRRTAFPEISSVPPIYFIARGPLACICRAETEPEIFFHDILNSDEVPDFVYRHILAHEFLHTRIRPRTIDGSLCPHPPEFWAEEKAISPAAKEACDWIMEHLGEWLVFNKREDGYYIHKDWYRRRSDIKRAAAMRRYHENR